MQFNSAAFIGLFAICYPIYFWIGKFPLLRKCFLTAAGLTFYYGLSPYAPIGLLLLGSLDFFLGKWISNQQHSFKKNIGIAVVITYHLSAMILFRYLPNAASWFPLWFKWIGLSFLVFRSIGYVLDVYHERIEEPEKSWLTYITYLSYFPILLSGPIAPAREFLPQLKNIFNPQRQEIANGLFLITIGVIKKYIFSQYISANFVDRVFESHEFFTGMENALAAVFQCLVVYLDFSGYTDMMLGISALLGITLPENFHFPYQAQNITDYWRRWHKTLSAWLNENIYFPLSFLLRKWKKKGTLIAVVVTFAVSGIWHGVGLHYLVWGLTHAMALCWDILSGPFRNKFKIWFPKNLYKWVSIIITFIFLSLSGVYFKASGLENAHAMFAHMFTKGGWDLIADWYIHYPWVAWLGFIALGVHWLPESGYTKTKNGYCQMPLFLQSVVLVLCIFIAYQISAGEALPFIYLQF